LAHGAVRFLILTLEAALLVLLLGAAVLAWRLSQGPVTLGAVAPYVASIFDEISPGFQFRVNDADFKWTGFSGAPELTVKDVRVLNASGGVIAALPSMVVRLSAPALRRGSVAPEHIRLTNPIIRFVRRADGSLGLGVQGAPVAATAQSPPAVPADAASVHRSRSAHAKASKLKIRCIGGR